MVFITKSNKIDEQEITSLYRLESPALERKEARDRELEAIIKGEDQRILLVIGPCSSDNEEAVMDYARRLADLQAVSYTHLLRLLLEFVGVGDSD